MTYANRRQTGVANGRVRLFGPKSGGPDSDNACLSGMGIRQLAPLGEPNLDCRAGNPYAPKIPNPIRRGVILRKWQSH